MNGKSQITIGVAILIAGAAMWLGTGLVPCGTPQATFREVRNALEDGDLESLLSRQCLGMKEPVASAIQMRGSREFERIVDMYDRQYQLGAEEFDRRVTRMQAILQTANELGTQGFGRLDSDARWAIWTGTTHRQFLYALAGPSVAAEHAAIVTDFEFLGDAARQVSRAEDLGCAAEGEDAVAILASVRSRQIDAGDAFVARILGRCRATGTRMVDRAVDAVEREMRRRDPGERNRPTESIAPGALERENQRKIEIGRTALSSENLTALSLNEHLLSANRDDEAWALGLPLLPPEEQAIVSPRTRDEFVAGRGLFVAHEGGRILRADLVSNSSACAQRIRQVEWVSPWGQGLIGRWGAIIVPEPVFGPEISYTVDGGPTVTSPRRELVPSEYLIGNADVGATWYVAVRSELLREGVVPSHTSCSVELRPPNAYVFAGAQWNATDISELATYSPRTVTPKQQRNRSR